jgi:hypothetical protein
MLPLLINQSNISRDFYTDMRLSYIRNDAISAEANMQISQNKLHYLIRMSCLGTEPYSKYNQTMIILGECSTCVACQCDVVKN